MGISLAGVAPRGERIAPGSYVVKALKDSIDRRQSNSGEYEQVRWFWRVLGGRSLEGEDFTGAEQRDMMTFTGNAPMIQEFVNLTSFAGFEVPQEFDSLVAMADWFARQLESEPTLVIVVRDKPNREGKVYPEISGYRKVEESDVPSDASGFGGGPGVNGAACRQDGCGELAVKDGLCGKHSVPF